MASAYRKLMYYHYIEYSGRSSGGVMVKLLACVTRDPWFDSGSRRYDFRDLLSNASRSRYG